MRLYELHKKGKTTHKIKYDYLYHLTDSQGFSHSVDSNTLKSLRNYYISTTHDPEMNAFPGGNHYNFKFVLDAKPLVKKYGAFTYDFQITYTDGTHESANEREIGIETKKIEPLSDYLIGVVLLSPIFSQTFLQDLLYHNPESKGFLDAAKSAAPRSVETLFYVIEKLKKPVWSIKVGQELTEKEWAFLKDIRTLHKRKASFKKGLLRLADKYQIKGHQGETLDAEIVARRQKADSLTKMFNKYFTSRKIKHIKSEQVAKLVVRGMRMLKYGDNIIGSIISKAKEENLFHKAVPPVEWSIVFRHLMDGDIEDAHEAIEYVANRNKWAIERFDAGQSFSQEGVHTGTHF